MSGTSKSGLMPGMNPREQRPRTSSPFPRSKSEPLDRAGINGRCHDKGGTESGLDARFNRLPPGMNIEDQRTAKIKPQPYLVFEGYSADGVVRADNHNHGAGAGYRVKGKV
jgi:hypothetical protein